MLALLPTDGSDPLVEVGEAPDRLTAPSEGLGVLRIDHDKQSPTTRPGDEK